MQIKSTRLLSLDVFRGATVAAMILVNNPGSWQTIYSPLKHAEWNGCTPTDLIFPFFLFIVGVSISYSYGTKKLDLKAHRSLIQKAGKRTLILFVLGLILSLFPRIMSDPIGAFEVVRIPGVLQRIAVVFFITAVLFLKNTEKNLLKIGISLLVLYWVLMNFIPVPGVGSANLGKETNLGAWLDRVLLTEAHLYQKTWDPEGILSTIPAIASCLFGVLVGCYLKREKISDSEKVAWLSFYGFLTFILGLIWGLQFPINKYLWTSSYVLYTGGLATLFLGLMYWIIDCKGYKKYTLPFLVYGVNAITVYFLSGILGRILTLIKVNTPDGVEINLKDWIFQSVFASVFSPINASLAYAFTYIVFWGIIVWIMYDRKIFIKV